MILLKEKDDFEQKFQMLKMNILTKQMNIFFLDNKFSGHFQVCIKI